MAKVSMTPRARPTCVFLRLDPESAMNPGAADCGAKAAALALVSEFTNQAFRTNIR